MKLPLFIDTIKLGMYNVIRQAKLEDIPDELGDLFKMSSLYSVPYSLNNVMNLMKDFWQKS